MRPLQQNTRANRGATRAGQAGETAPMSPQDVPHVSPARRLEAYSRAGDLPDLASQDEIDEMERMGAPGSGVLVWGLLLSLVLIALGSAAIWVIVQAVMFAVNMGAAE